MLSLASIPSLRFDEYDILNPSFLGSWVGQFGFFPFLFVFITVVVTWKKHGIFMSLLNLTGAVLGIAVLVCAAGISAAYILTVNKSGTSLPLATASKDREVFVSGATQACIKKFETEWKARQLPDKLLSEYCGCGASNIADLTTRDEMIYYGKNGTLAPSLMEKLEPLNARCGEIIYNGTR